MLFEDHDEAAALFGPSRHDYTYHFLNEYIASEEDRHHDHWNFFSTLIYGKPHAPLTYILDLVAFMEREAVTYNGRWYCRLIQANLFNSNSVNSNFQTIRTWSEILLGPHTRRWKENLLNWNSSCYGSLNLNSVREKGEGKIQTGKPRMHVSTFTETG